MRKRERFQRICQRYAGHVMSLGHRKRFRIGRKSDSRNRSDVCRVFGFDYCLSVVLLVLLSIGYPAQRKLRIVGHFLFMFLPSNASSMELRKELIFQMAFVSNKVFFGHQITPQSNTNLG